MSVNLTTVASSNDIAKVAELAKEIWTQHFTPIIGCDQVAYMLNKFQSVDAVSAQIADGCEYYLASLGGEFVGYLGLFLDAASKRIMLSKIYVKQIFRGKGVGKSMLKFVEQKSQSENIGTIWLTVNRFNSGAINWYLRHGFIVIEEQKKDIGGEFYMDDFVMEKKLALD